MSFVPLAAQPPTRDPILEALDRPDFRAVRVMLDRLKVLGKTISGYPIARPGDFAALTTRLEAILSQHARLFETGNQEMISSFFDILGEYQATSITAYGAEALRLQFLRARALIIIGKAHQALEIVAPWADCPYRIEGGFGQIQDAFELDLSARLVLGRLDEVVRLAFARVMLLASFALLATPFIFIRFYKALSVRSATVADQHWLQPLLRIAAGLCLFEQRGGRRSRFDKAMWRALRLAAQVAAGVGLTLAVFLPGNKGSVQLKSNPSPPPARLKPETPLQTDIPAILVTRAMGGLGDIMMMTPGLRALRKKYGRKIAFAIPKKFHPAFHLNPDFDLLDSDSFIDLGRYRAWYNLGLCPAGIYESRKAPRIKKGRVELFAAGMGVKKALLDRIGWQPACYLDAAQRTKIGEIRDRARGKNLPVIGFQIHSRDTYKDYPGLNRLIDKLAERALVLAIHTSPSPIPTHPNVIPIFNKALSEAVASVASSDIFIAVDSGFYHFAAAFDIPAIGLFGPTSGKTFSRHHKRFSLIEVQPKLRCSPCWRNEDEKCVLNGTFESACMAGIPVEQVLTAVDGWLGATALNSKLTV